MSSSSVLPESWIEQESAEHAEKKGAACLSPRSPRLRVSLFSFCRREAAEFSNGFDRLGGGRGRGEHLAQGRQELIGCEGFA